MEHARDVVEETFALLRQSMIHKFIVLPMPRTLSINDLCALAKTSHGARLDVISAHEIADRLLDAAEQAYLEVSMLGALDKDVRGQSQATFGGLDVNGWTGLAGAPVDRMMVLATISLFIAGLL